jgi:hypothetical protein
VLCPVYVACTHAASVSIENTTNPSNPNFQVGNSSLVTITGAAAKATVQNCATQNGVSAGCTDYGSTNGSGGFTLPGSMSPTIFEGKWVENWSVGGVAVPPTLTFFVGSATPPSIYGPNPECSGSGTPSIAFWWLGGQPSTSGYQTTWTACANLNSADVDPTVTWSSSNEKIVGIGSSAIGSATLEANGPSPPGPTLQYTEITVTVDGVTSVGFPVYIDQPYTQNQLSTATYCYVPAGCNCPALFGQTSGGVCRGRRV